MVHENLATILELCKAIGGVCPKLTSLSGALFITLLKECSCPIDEELRHSSFVVRGKFRVALPRIAAKP